MEYEKLIYETYSKELLRLSKKYNFKPSLMKEIMLLQSQGYSYLEIAKRIRVTRQTVSRYVKTIKSMEIRDFYNSLYGAVFVVGGLSLLSKVFKTELTKKQNRKKANGKNRHETIYRKRS